MVLLRGSVNNTAEREVIDVPDPNHIEQTVYRGGTGEITVKKSRFIANVAAVETKEEAEEFIASLKKKYWDAKHNCSAYRISGPTITVHSSDDGEPSGTAGKPMAEVLEKEHILNACVVVTRYFGGVLLGTGGLIRAYTDALKEGLKDCILMTKKDGISAEFIAEYDEVGRLQYFYAQNDIRMVKCDYNEKVDFSLLIPVERFKDAEEEINRLTGGKRSLSNVEEVSYADADGELLIWKKTE